jgi:hypothetical protein
LSENASGFDGVDRIEVHARQKLLLGIEPCEKRVGGAPRQLPKTDGRRYLLSGTAASEVRDEVRIEVLAAVAVELAHLTADDVSPQARARIAERAVVATDRALARVGVSRAL